MTLRAFRSMTIGLALVGQLVALLHMGLVRHDVCAEHGDLVEHTHAAVDHADLGRAGLHAVALDRDGDDDHCVATLMARSFAAHAPHAAPLDVASFEIIDARVAPTFGAAIASFAVLDVAPKQGPPFLAV